VTLRPLWLAVAGAGLLCSGGRLQAATTASSQSPCWQKGNTLAISQCFAASGSAADAALNHSYARILRVLDDADRRALQLAERRWIAFRDASCGAEHRLWQGGTGGAPAYLACLDDETRRRLDYLDTTYRLRLQKPDR
jgi:uncharacterized protein YecT (DUF1311 family)